MSSNSLTSSTHLIFFHEEFTSEPPFQKISQSPDSPSFTPAKAKAEETPFGDSANISQIEAVPFSAVSHPTFLNRAPGNDSADDMVDDEQ
ncbi:hypothetical protein N7527_003586 [Penicillium freii]|nr:hypothetical protein N7527_003586 [Penicillium freii]